MSAAVIPIIGAVVSAAGSVWLAKQESKNRMKEQAAEEARAAKRYEGIGEAADIKTPDQLEEQLGRDERAEQRVGAKPERMGDRYNRDEELSTRGLGRRPQIAKLLAPDTGTSQSVAQGAAPKMSQFAMNSAGVPPTGVTQVTGQQSVQAPGPARPRYNPETGRIEYGDTPQAPAAPSLPALPARPAMNGR